jgi:thiol-disulfide isomerase/thioredoxin
MWFVFRDFFGLPVVITYCLGVMSAYFYFKNNPPKNILPLALSSCFVVFMFFQGWAYWIHKIDYGTFTGRIEAYKLQTNFEAFDEQKNLVADNNFQNKIVLLDFWYTRCGVCFEKFPQVQAVYDKYRNDSSVAIFAVDKPIDEDKPGEAFNVIKEKGYSFPVVIAKDEELPEKFGVKGYPTTFVIDRNGMIVFKGGIEGAIKMVDNLKNN